MILKNLWRRKTRTILTMLGIAVGVAAVVALSAFGEGFASGFEKMFATADADLLVAQKDAIIVLIGAVDESIGDELKQIGGVTEVVGTVASIVQMPAAPYFIVMGEDPRGFAIKHYRIIEGEAISAKKQIMLGKIAAKNFKKTIGENFRLNEVNYRVVGIYETGVSFEDGGAVMTLADAQRAFDKAHQVTYFKVRVKEPRRIDEIKKEIESRWQELAATRSGEATQQNETIGLYRSFGWFLGIFAILIGGLGMMNAMLMSVIERTREIGVLRAVGWRRRRIIGMILGESVALSLSGGILGILLGIGLTQLARLSPAVETLLSGVFTPTMLMQAMVTALLLGAVGGVYPAWRAAQLAPVEAMRYEGGSGGNLGPVTRALARLFGSSAMRNLFRRPTRTLVTALGIGIGVGFIVAMVAVTEGFVVTFTQMASGGQADLLAEQAKASDLSFSVIDERTADKIKLQPGVRAVSRILFGTATAPGLPYFFVMGIDPREDYIKHYRIREGRGIENPREIMLGRFAANGLRKTVGETMHLGGSGFDIVGIYENGAAFDDAGGTVLLKDAQQIFNKPRQVSMLAIAVGEPARADEIAKTLETKFPEVIVSKASAFTQRIQDMQTTYTILNALVVLTLVVGGIVMMNAMLMSVFERTQEIGVLRAVGWRRRRIVWMVLVESLALSCVSALVGIALGVGLGQLFTLIPAFGAFLAPTYPPAVFLQVIVFAVVLGAIGGFYPAWRAAGLRPIEALRYE